MKLALRLGLALLLVLIAALAIAFFTRDRWTPRFLSWAGPRFVGDSIEVDALEWIGLSHLDLRGVRVAGMESGAALREVRVDTLSIDLDLRELARHGLAGLHGVEAGRVEASIDLSSGQPSGTPSTTSSSPIPAEWPRGLPPVHVRDLDLRLQLSASSSLSLDHAALRLDPNADEAALELTTERIAFRDGQRTVARPLALQATWRAGEIAFSRFEVDPDYRVQRLSVDLRRVAEGEIGVDTVLGAFGGEHEIHAALAHGSVSARLRSRALDLAPALAVLAPDVALELAGRVDVDADVALPLADPLGVTGRVAFDAFGLHVGNRTFDWVRAELAADAKAWRAKELIVLEGANQARVSDAFLPREVRDPCEILPRLSCAFEAELEDLPGILAAVGEPDVVFHPHRASIRGWILGGLLELDGGELRATGGRLAIDRARVPIAADWRVIATDPRLDLRMNARFDEIAPLAAILSLPPSEGRIEGAVAVIGGATGLHGWADVHAQDLRVAGQELGSVAGHCDLSRRRLDVEHVLVVGPDASLDLHGSYAFDERRFDGLHARGWLRDASVLRLALVPHGGIELDAEISGRWPEIDGRVFARADALETEALGPVRAEVTARSTRGRIDVDALALETGYGHVDARGTAGTLAELTSGTAAKCLRFDALEWRDNGRHLALAEPADVELSGSGVSVSRLAIAGDGVSLEATLTLEGEHGKIRSSLHAIEPGPWIAPFAPDVRCKHVDLDLDADWSSIDVSGRARGRAEMLQVGSTSPPADVEIDGTLKDKRVVLERLSVAAVFASESAETGEPARGEAPEEPLVLTGEFPLDLRGKELLPEGPIRLDGAFVIPDLARVARTLGANSRNVKGRLRAELDLQGTWSEPKGSIAFEAADLSWTPRPNEPPFGPCSIRGEIDLDRDLSIKSLALDLPAGVRADGQGRVSGPFDARSLLRGEALAWRAAPLDFALHLEASDLSLLTVMIPSLRRLGGRLQGNVKLAGTFAEPRYSGELELADGELRAASALPSLSGLTAKLALDGDKIRLDGLNGEMGGAPFSLKGTISPFAAEPSVDLELEGRHLLLYRATGLRVRADAKLSITGEVRALDLRGQVSLDDSRFTRDFDFLAVFGKHNPSPPLFSRPLFELGPPFDKATLDVKVDSVTPFKIANNVINGGVRADLRLVGTGALPILRGTIVIDPTRVSLPSGKISTRSGAVEFLPSAPFAPRIDAMADARLQGYDIKIHIGGTIEEPVVELSSIPPLSHEDLLLLVLTGTLPRTDLKSPTGTRAAKSVAVYFANDLIGSWFRSPEGGIDSDDILEVETGRDASETGVESATARLRVWKGIFSKNSSLYVTGERDIYDRYNFGLRVLFKFK